MLLCDRSTDETPPSSSPDLLNAVMVSEDANANFCLNNFYSLLFSHLIVTWWGDGRTPRAWTRVPAPDSDGVAAAEPLNVCFPAQEEVQDSVWRHGEADGPAGRGTEEVHGQTEGEGARQGERTWWLGASSHTPLTWLSAFWNRRRRVNFQLKRRACCGGAGASSVPPGPFCPGTGLSGSAPTLPSANPPH